MKVPKKVTKYSNEVIVLRYSSALGFAIDASIGFCIGVGVGVGIGVGSNKCLM